MEYDIHSYSALEVLEKHGKTFAFAGKLLDRKSLDSCARLYQFCRYADDLVDDAKDKAEAKSKLNLLSQELKAGSSSDVVIQDFIDLSVEFNLDPRVTDELLTGLSGDLEQVRIQTIDDLLTYCYRVAGTVGLHMCSIFSVQEPTARAHAIDLGIAMQLTNICRDVTEDAEGDRRYLPSALVGQLEPSQILEPRETDAQSIKRSVSELLDLADQYYRSGFAGLAFLPPRFRTTIAVAARLYQEIGCVIKKRGYDVWLGRAYVDFPNKVLKGLIAALSLLHRRALSEKHNPKLHRGLGGLPWVSIN